MPVPKQIKNVMVARYMCISKCDSAMDQSHAHVHNLVVMWCWQKHKQDRAITWKTLHPICLKAEQAVPWWLLLSQTHHLHWFRINPSSNHKINNMSLTHSVALIAFCVEHAELGLIRSTFGFWCLLLVQRIWLQNGVCW